MTTPNDVNTPSLAWQEMAKTWEITDPLRGGTRAMRDAGTALLPRFPLETSEAYDFRRGNSFLFPSYDETIKRLVARPFSRAIVLQGTDGLDDRLAAIEFDADGTGRSLTEFARAWFTDAVDRGLSHILVEFPKNEKRSVDDSVRPYFVHVSPRDLIGGPGRQGLDRIRIRECVTKQVDEFGEVEVRRVRVIKLLRDDQGKLTGEGAWELHEENDKGDFVVIEEGPYDLERIALATLPINVTGPLTGVSPLESLAWVNVRHWQSSSDQNHALAFARSGLLFAKGWDEKQVSENLRAVGPNRVVFHKDPEADLKYVEHSGASIQAGERDIDKLERQMEVLGNKPMMRRTGTTTATERVADEGDADCAVKAWIQLAEAALYQAFELAALWLDVALPDDFAVNIYSDFRALDSSDGADSVQKARDNRDISLETYLTEMQRRGVLSEDLKIEDEIERIEKEAAAVPAVSPPIVLGEDPVDPVEESSAA